MLKTLLLTATLAASSAFVGYNLDRVAPVLINGAAYLITPPATVESCLADLPTTLDADTPFRPASPACQRLFQSMPAGEAAAIVLDHSFRAVYGN